MRQPIIGVMGPGEQATPAQVQLAYELGAAIAQAGWILLTGGRKAGVMDAASRGAKNAGGLTVGILPSSDRTQLSDAVDIPIFTDMGNARNAITVLSCDGVVACGMGLGTASEVALALKSGKFVVLLNVTEVEQQFFQHFAQMQISVTDSVSQAIAMIQLRLNYSQ
ncbi:MAG: TIGR00725 family protein [Leptolyngbyaceae cyanobacterium bins.302]|nr:TIGR00725 family protein [Leptolyngbyaceae cyanobacterium bins.302]